MSKYINTQRSTANPNVFINLYEVAKARQERSCDEQREAKQRELKKSEKQCTFKPDLIKTQKITEKYLRNKSRMSVGHKPKQQQLKQFVQGAEGKNTKKKPNGRNMSQNFH